MVGYVDLRTEEEQTEMSIIARIRTCVNCKWQYIPKKEESKICPKCHLPWNIKGRGQSWRKTQK